TCPCALSLATPATLVAAARGLAARGVLLRRLDALEAMARADQVCLDKTGTLTQAGLVPAGVTLWPDAGFDQAQAWARASGLAAWSTHPVSAALAATPGAEPATDWQGVREVPGQGLEAQDASGRRWRLGSHAWVAPGQGGEPGREEPSGPSLAAWLGVDDRPVARFTLDEALRPDAAEAVAALDAAGLGVTLLSGDRSPQAQALGARVGISRVVGSASPEGKLEHVRRLQAEGHRVVMVGDGLNDTPVMAAADVSVAMGSAALAARHPCDAVIVSGAVAGVAHLRATAVLSMRLIRQNLVWALVYNAACIPLAAAGGLPPWAAGLGMALSSLAVMLNAQRAAGR
ncbi:MAG: hypothetical protein RL087_1853, partial [Pseudomonadota bacterium]